MSANVLVTAPGGGQIAVKRSDSQSGIGDLVLIPLMPKYNVDPDFNVNFRVAAYAPTGDFEGKTVGLGPVVSYVGKIAAHDVIAELKWLHESDTEKRLEGDMVWLKVVFKFY